MHAEKLSYRMNAAYALSQARDLEQARDRARQLLEYRGGLGQADIGPLILPALKAAQSVLPGFATVDSSLVASIQDLRNNLLDYIADSTRYRPYNVLLLAPPGSGKSHFINCLAKHVKSAAAIGNLSIESASDVLIYAVNEARNSKAQDIVPVLFLDEVDSRPSLIPSLLPLLWDGEFFTRGQVLKLGRCIIFCAASRPEFRGQGQLTGIAKIEDFLSRFNGGAFEIPPIDNETRRFDRVFIAVQLIKRRFPWVINVGIGLLQWLALVPVQHQVRSMEFLVSLIPPIREVIVGIGLGDGDATQKKIIDALSTSDSSGSPLGFHIATEHRTSALELWDMLSRYEEVVQISE